MLFSNNIPTFNRFMKLSNKIYYHGSFDFLEEGTILTPEKSASKNSDFGYSIMESHNKAELFKPKEFLSRENAVFMCDDLDDLDLSGASLEHIYIVNPLGKIEKHDINWLSEIDLIMSEAKENGLAEDVNTVEKVKEAALNYWHGVAHYNESVWEYLTPKAEIITEIEED